MIRTKKAITDVWRMGGGAHSLTIPAGTRCSVASHGQFFVEDLSWLDRNSMAWHDANYYGIRLNADQVEDDQAPGPKTAADFPSTPYLAVAQRYGMPYRVILNYADIMDRANGADAPASTIEQYFPAMKVLPRDWLEAPWADATRHAWRGEQERRRLVALETQPQGSTP